MNRYRITIYVTFLLLATQMNAVRRGVADEKSPTAALTDVLKNSLPRMGHRNWIVVADMAYPAQSSAGIKTIYVGGSHLETVKHVLDAIDAAPHVRGEVVVDRELSAVDEQAAPGVTAYRQTLSELFTDRSIDRRLHEEIIHELDAEVRTFEVLILKTDMTIPYTSVFVRLDCGYWSPEAERQLRESIASPTFSPSGEKEHGLRAGSVE